MVVAEWNVLQNYQDIVLLESFNDVHVMAVMFGHPIDCSNAMSTTSGFQLMDVKEKRKRFYFFPAMRNLNVFI